ncbi:MAG: A24 family peptidase [Phycisphaerales bacterium]|nr:MAG: A24 family peptidase [Phycisphaerales bacterium]
MSSVLVTVWWLFLCTAVGLCLGSFLNAVVYRLPRNRSLWNPLWSFCPACKHRIRWHDNLPLISFILLRGRCRYCGIPISTRYLVVEASMALIVLMLLDAFFIGHVRAGISDSQLGLMGRLTDRLSYDWPIFLAHVILFACLLPMSIIDLEHYWVDVRFTNLATIAGFVLHTLWTPKQSTEWIRPFDTTAIVCLFAVAAMGIIWVLLICEPHVDAAELGEPEIEEPPPSPAEARPPRIPPPSLESPSRAGGWVAGLLLAGTLLALAVDETGAVELRHMGRALPPLLLFFGLIVWESTVQRPSDHQIVDAIYQERHGARRMVLTEFALLIPVILAAAVGWWIMASPGGLSTAISDALHARTGIGGLALLRSWSPLYGLATAATGYVIAGAVGWTVRIVFTLVFGKEAFGSGDIHLMAAAGCVAGWPVVVLGFFLTCGLAMVGWVAALPFKRTRALPLGPWLSLSFLAVVLFYDSIIEWPLIARAIDVARLLFFDVPQPAVLESIP